ncbi:MAG TPA: 1-deoxy-D-xylulose-5-phosphate reductoisomerase [Xanthomonadales bacterium]|nr:1-deoxy-D-xylulose-5-phosphate reductoisomerase [Xanthomonadales bacterium]
MAQKIAVLGSTGSVGTNTLDVIARNPDRFEVVALTAHSNAKKLARQCKQFNARLAVISDPDKESLLAQELSDLGCDATAMSGAEALLEAVAHPELDTVMASIVGAAGLAPTLHAAERGLKVLLANKESMVIAGQLLISAARQSGAKILPVDSEHNAVFQALPEEFSLRSDNPLEDCGVDRIILTASGGPFLTTPAEELKKVTPDQACAHPNWDMGRKISVDSATLMNKGLELIEAHWLFGARPDQLKVLIHPQSIVHSMVCYRDGSVLAQLGSPDMRTPIAHTLAWPGRIDAGVERLDLAKATDLTFMDPDTDRFPGLNLAYQAMKVGRNAPITLNAANEVAVECFLNGQIAFDRIASIVSKVLDTGSIEEISSIEDIMACDERVRHVTREFCRNERH